MTERTIIYKMLILPANWQKALCTASLSPNKVILDHTLSFTFVPSSFPFTPCSAYYHHAAGREWFKTYAFRFKKLMLGLGRSLFSHLWPRQRISAEILKSRLALCSALWCLISLTVSWSENRTRRLASLSREVLAKYAWLTRWLMRPMVSTDSFVFPPWEMNDNTSKMQPQPAQVGYRSNEVLLHQSTQGSKSCSTLPNTLTVPPGYDCCWLEHSQTSY